MQKIAFYRKYRPENFDQTIGQEHILTVLKNAITSDKISHAYLFTGPRGTGKTSVARILSKAINCQNRKPVEYNPCGKCPVCVGIAEDRVMDLIEIDAASNRGIDEMRDLREKVKFSPTEAKFKVFIIDEVHMLTKEAFNALLKTLEEPPSHAIFILATTEINKVPSTIISRCQRHDFKRITVTDLESRLSEVSKKEKITISDDALETISEASEGGLRDALSLLDQLASIGLTKIEEKDVESILGLAPHKMVAGFAAAILAGDSKKALEVLETASTEGIDLVIFTKSLIDFTRKLILVKLAGANGVEGTAEQVEELKQLAEKTSTQAVVKFSDDLLWAQNAFRTSIDPKAILTVLCAKSEAAQAPTAVAPEAVVAKTQQTAKPAAKAASGTPNVDLNGKWKHFLMEVKAKNNTIHAFLRVAHPTTEGNVLVLAFPYKFHKERLEEPKNKRFVEELLTKIYGREMELRCELEGGGYHNKQVEDPDTAASILGGEVVD
jgi:DNA polymerase III subunit gamma/tau